MGGWRFASFGVRAYTNSWTGPTSEKMDVSCSSVTSLEMIPNTFSFFRPGFPLDGTHTTGYSRLVRWISGVHGTKERENGLTEYGLCGV